MAALHLLPVDDPAWDDVTAEIARTELQTMTVADTRDQVAVIRYPHECTCTCMLIGSFIILRAQ